MKKESFNAIHNSLISLLNADIKDFKESDNLKEFSIDLYLDDQIECLEGDADSYVYTLKEFILYIKNVFPSFYKERLNYYKEIKEKDLIKIFEDI